MSLARRLLVANPSVQVSSLLRGGFATPSAPLATDTNHAGYIGNTNTSGTIKFIFKYETMANVSPGLFVTNPSVTSLNISGWGSGYSYSGYQGYHIGGTGINGAASPHNFIYKLVYSTEIGSKLSTTLSKTNHDPSCVAEAGVAGYAFGGSNSGFADRYDTIEKMPFSTETNAIVSGSFTRMGNATAAMSNGSTVAYTLGGEDEVAGTHNYVNKFTYSSSTYSNNIQSLSPGTRSIGTVSNHGTAGYGFGGWDGSIRRTDIKKITYSSDTLSIISASLPIGTHQNGFNPDAYQYAGYNITGDTSVGNVGIVSRLVYATETRTTLSNRCCVGRAFTAGSMNNNGVGRG
jgi:hypothetical protein